MPEKLELMAPLFEQDPEMAIASHDHRRVDASLRDLKVKDDTNDNVRMVTSHDPSVWSSLFRKSILHREGFWLGSAFMINRNKLDVALFDSILDQHESLVKWCFLDTVIGPFIVATNPNATIGFVNQVLMLYRIHEKNSSGNMSNLQNAIESITRNQSVNQLTYQVIERFAGTDKSLEEKYRYLNQYSEWMRLKYEKKHLAAFQLYVQLIPRFIHHGQLVKETQRLLLTSILGVEKFLRLKNR